MQQYGVLFLLLLESMVMLTLGRDASLLVFGPVG
jgi:hypothetical protein